MGPDEINEYERYLHSLQRGIKGPGGHMVTPPRTYGIRSPAGIRGPLGALALVASGLAVQRAHQRSQRKLEDPGRAAEVLLSRRWPREDAPRDGDGDGRVNEGQGGRRLAIGAGVGTAGGLVAGRTAGSVAGGIGGGAQGAMAGIRFADRPLRTTGAIPTVEQAGRAGALLVNKGAMTGARRGARFGGRLGLGLGAVAGLGSAAIANALRGDGPREERGHSARGVMLAGLLAGGAGAAGGGYAGARLGEAEGLYAARMRTLVGLSRPMSEMGLPPSEMLEPPFTRMPYHNPQNQTLGNWPRGGTNPQFQQLGNTVLPNQAVNKKITFSPGNWNNYAPGTAAESELIRAEQKWARNALMNPQVGEATRARMLAGGRKWGTRAGLAGLGIGLTAAMLGRARRRQDAEPRQYKRERNGQFAAGAGAGVGGATGAAVAARKLQNPAARERALSALSRTVGAQTFAHGTTSGAVGSILQEGIRPSTSFAGTGAFVATGPNRSEVAQYWGNHASEMQARTAAHERKMAFIQKNKRLAPHQPFIAMPGRVVHGVMPHEQFASQFTRDPVLKRSSFMAAGTVGPQGLTEAAPGARQILAARARNPVAYAARNPRRFLRGVAGLGRVAAPALAGAVLAGSMASAVARRRREP